MPTVNASFIAIGGNIGSGKTELTTFLTKKYGLRAFFEPNDANPYLELFYKDMKKWAFHSQLFFLSHKLRLHRQIEESGSGCVQDRTIYEDAEIFAKNLYRQRLMPKRDFDTYWSLYESISKSLRAPDLMIFLKCPVRTIQERIRIRGRSMEQKIPYTYLRRLNSLYSDWFAEYRASATLTLETDKLDYLSNLVDRADLFRQIEKFL